MISRQMDLQKETNYYNLLLGEETERYVLPDSGLETDYESSRTVQF